MKLTFTSPYNKNVASVYAEVEQTDQDDFGNGEYCSGSSNILGNNEIVYM